MATNTIPSDAASIFDALSASQKNALAYPSPSPGGIAGLIFDWVGEERLELRSDITDSWLEDNTAVNDQIALYPERFTVDASTAEVVFAPNNTSTNPSQPLNPLSLNIGMVPTLTPGAASSLASTAINGLVPGVIASSLSGLTAILAQSASQVLAQTVQTQGVFSALPSTLGPALIGSLGSDGSQSAGNALGQAANSTDTAVAETPNGLYGYYQGLNGSNPPNRQVSIMGFIYQLWKGRVLFTVETPWGIFTSMAIELSDGVQPQETEGQTDHKITFKKVRIAGDPTDSSGQQLGRSNNQAAEGNPSLNGNIGQSEISSQLTTQILNGWTAPTLPTLVSLF